MAVLNPMSPRDNKAAAEPPPQWFATTHWSVVLAAGQSDSPQAASALEKLCRVYWLPIYSYVRQRGKPPHDALDLTQGFFALLLERNDFATANPDRGRFRSFLLTALNHFLANQHDRVMAAKRGGGNIPISLDDDTVEQRYQLEPVTDLSPDKIYERRWALAVMEQAINALSAEFADSDKSRHFELLKQFLTEEAAPGEYGPIGRELGLTEGAVAVNVHRLRQRYRELVRLEVAQTVASPLEIEDEMRHLLSLL